MVDADVLRREVAILVKAEGQQRFGREIGVHQSIVSRYLTGGRLTPALAKGLYARYPALRDLVTAVHFAAGDMQESNRDTASVAAS